MSSRVTDSSARRPPRVAGVEFGGTKIVLAARQSPERRSAAVRLPTEAPGVALPAAIAALRSLEAKGPPFEAIGVAAFGPLQLDPTAPGFGRMLTTPKPGWSGQDLLGPLAEAFPVPIVLETDVNAAAIAEGSAAAEGLADYAYITVGTGVGVGLVVGGHRVHGAGHPEAGHLLVRPVEGERFPGACFAHGACVEGMISGPALARRLGRPLEQADPGPETWEMAGDYLAQLCMALVLTTAPARIVIGGGVGARAELLQATRRRLWRHLGGYPDRYRAQAAVDALLVGAALEHSGLEGALALAEAAALGRRDQATVPVMPAALLAPGL